MELIPVNSQKLKIILTKDDMDGFDITNEELDVSSPKTRKVLGEILEKARAEAGFDTIGKLYIQAFPSIDGGCEMFFTKKSKLFPEPEEKKRCFSGYKKREPELSDGNEHGCYIAISHNIDNIISMCIRLHKEGFDGKSDLLSLGKEYMLIIDFTPKNHSTKIIESYPDDDSRFCFICDYCFIRYADPIPIAYIKEHGKYIIEGTAVESLRRYFH